MMIRRSRSNRLLVSSLSFPARRLSASSSSSKTSSSKKDEPTSSQLFLHAGFPMIGFALLAAWVVSRGLEGKTKEFEVAHGRASKSERQARMEKEHQDMLQKLEKIRKTEFDNTKRIERPEEILERRRKERERRNVWYRRWWRNVTGQASS